MPTPLTDADKVIRNDTGKAIAAAIEALAAPEADHVSYDNTSSGLAATDVQDAIDELKTKNDTKMDKANPTGTGSLSLNRASSSIVGTRSVAVGYNGTASGDYSYAEGQATISSGQGSHSEGRETQAIANYAHAEGYKCVASGQRSHAEGTDTTASGSYSHAEGNSTNATVNQAHSEGYLTEASGNASHAENYGSKASGAYSHAEGLFTEANHRSQHTSGEYNLADPSTSASNTRGTYIEIVGNGSNNENRSNARTLDWNGNETLAGGLKLHENQDAATLNLTGSIAASGGTLDCSSYSDGAIIYLYRPTANKVGIYVKANTWTRVIPILPISTVSVSGYVITNNDANEILRGTVIST